MNFGPFDYTTMFRSLYGILMTLMSILSDLTMRRKKKRLGSMTATHHIFMQKIGEILSNTIYKRKYKSLRDSRLLGAFKNTERSLESAVPERWFLDPTTACSIV